MNLVTQDKAYEGNIFEALEQAFYEDVDPLDLYEVYKAYPGVGPQEVLDTLLDYAVGDLYVGAPPPQTHPQRQKPLSASTNQDKSNSSQVLQKSSIQS